MIPKPCDPIIIMLFPAVKCTYQTEFVWTSVYCYFCMSMECLKYILILIRLHVKYYMKMLKSQHSTSHIH